jgi:hypothetical protein
MKGRHRRPSLTLRALARLPRPIRQRLVSALLTASLAFTTRTITR